jgi:hypothetical protein
MKKKIIIGISCTIILILVITSAYIIFYLKKPTTTVYIDPQTIKGTMGQVFMVNISISEVVNLYGWQTKLEWNPQILEVVNVTEGSFLKNHGSTYFNEKFNETGYLLLDCTLIGDLPGASGSGVLATIQFSVKGSGSCNLQLSETTLINSTEQLIQHTVKNGQFST